MARSGCRLRGAALIPAAVSNTLTYIVCGPKNSHVTDCTVRVAGHTLDNRTIGPIVAIAAFSQFEQCPAQRLQRFDLAAQRSEEHTSEFQSLMRTSHAVFCLKKNNH